MRKALTENMNLSPSTTTVDRPSARRQTALRFLVDRIDYERTLSMPSSEEAFKLDRMRELLRRLGDPQNRTPIIHIAGTKGKGSTAAMLTAVLSAAGHRTGLFTSPHFDRVEERMAVDAQPCSPEELADLIEHVRPVVEAMDRAATQENPPEHGPTYFEIITATALCHFARRAVDAAILEVGLGGRLDSTNVCTPALSVITSISFDHTQQLGETLAAIAAEKAGIIKPGVPVVSGVGADEPRDVVRHVARQNGCRLVELDVDFDFDYDPPRHLEQAPSPGRLDFRHASSGTPSRRSVDHFTDISLGLPGRHQAANAALVLAAAEELRRNGWTIPEAAIRQGLAETAWPARIEVVARRPAVVLDAAHNVASVEALAEVLAESFAVGRRLLVFATTQGKDVRGMLERLLGRFDDVVFTRYADNPRGVPPEQLQALAYELTATRYFACVSAVEAWAAVERMATPDDLICVTGSFFIAAELRRHLVARPSSPLP